MVRLCLVLLLAIASCGDDGVASAEDARRAYIGLDPSIDKAINLGFDGFNMASNANISPQTANSSACGSPPMMGTLTVTGQVDQGVSANKSMRLFTAYVSYSDDCMIKYATDPAALPALTMMLMNIPNGTLTGTLVGKVTMTGMETGDLMLNLTFSGMTEAGPNNTVVRKPGTTHITGTATSRYGTYAVDVTR